MKSILLMFVFLFLIGCDRPLKKYDYIETERGLIRFAAGYCRLGMVTNNDGVNLLDENSKPITCKGYIKLTEVEAKKYNREF